MDTPAAIPPQLARLRIKHLTLLHHVATHGSLRQVAAQLHVTQPAVTAMLKDLESAFGAGLVRRDRQGASLTERGEAARRRLDAILNGIEAVKLASSMAPTGRLLRVGVLPVAMVGMASQAIARLQAEGAGITLKLVEQTVESALADLFANRLDCAISRVDANTLSAYPRDAFEFDPLLPVDMKIACGRGHPLARRRTVTLQELRQQSWAVLAVDSQIRIAFEQAFVQGGLTPPTPVVESLSFVSNLHLVRHTAGLLTIAPASAIDDFRAMGIVEQVNFTWPVSLSPIMLITRRDTQASSELATFRAVLHACARSIRNASGRGAL